MPQPVGFPAQIRIGAEQLNKVVMLKLMNRFKRPIMPREMEIRIDPGTIFPVGRERFDDRIQNIFFMEQFRARPKLHIAQRFARHFKRTCAIGQLTEVERDIRGGFHMPPEIIGKLTARPPAKWIRVARSHVQCFRFGPFRPGNMHVRMGKSRIDHVGSTKINKPFRIAQFLTTKTL